MRSSLYPQRPPDSHLAVAAQADPSFLSFYDRIAVYLSSLSFVGSIFWVPALYGWIYRRWRSIPREQTRRRAIYSGILLALLGIGILGPHRSEKVGERIRVRHWSLWKSWVNFFALEVIYDFPSNLEDRNDSNDNWKNDQAILAIIPHGIFPFSLAFAALPQIARQAFGKFRPVVATATRFVPIIHSFISWIHGVNASKHHVEKALANGDRIGVAPGGIAEMFLGNSSSSNSSSDDEYAILNSRKGFIRLAIKHGIPVIPVYCFGGSQILSQVSLPSIIERISLFLRISICLFFGKFGLPIPFRQRLLYVVGKPIYPPRIKSDHNNDMESDVDEMHKQFCVSLTNIFNKYKDYYGWGDKRLQII